MILFDVMFLPLVEKVWKSCPTVKHWVALTDPEHMPSHSSVPGLLNYEQLLQGRHRGQWDGLASLDSHHVPADWVPNPWRVTV